MEPRFGRDFSGVRVHNGPAAAQSARAVNARAWTVGDHIAFAPGEYRPDTSEGRGLLAHELAHTVQQNGLQRYPSSVDMGGPLESPLEREAESAAREVMRAGNSSAPTLSRAPASVVSRAAARCPDKIDTESTTGEDWTTPPPALAAGDVIKVSKPITAKFDKPEAGKKPGIVKQAFLFKNFELPPTKGPVLNCWRQRAKAGALGAKYSIDTDPQLVFSQGSPRTQGLRDLWEQKLGWSKDNASAQWIAAKGKSYDPPKDANNKTCAMDHIVELQVGGNGSEPSNIQLLEAGNNSSAGSKIRGYLVDKANFIKKNVTDVDEVHMYFDDVTRAGPGLADDGCVKLEDDALALAGKVAVPDQAPPDTDSYPISAGGVDHELRVGKKNKAEQIMGSSLNDGAALLIPGMLLKQLQRTSPKSIHGAGDHVNASIDTEKRPRKKLPMTFPKDPEIRLDVLKQGHLKLHNPNQHIGFEFPYLSKGEITKLEFDETAGLSGSGVIHPTPKFLPDLKFHFGPESFALEVGIDEGKLKGKEAVKGFKITKAQIDLPLYPEFKPSGTIGLEFAPGKKLAEGEVTVSAEDEKLKAHGTIQAYIPGIDKTEITVDYMGGEWSGSVTIEAKKINLPYVDHGTVTVALGQGGLKLDGKVGLKLPGENTIEVSYRQGGGGWILGGSGTFKVPKLGVLNVNATYDGTHLHAWGGGVKFTVLGVTGTLDKVDYVLDTQTDKSIITGEGSAHFEKGKAKGDLKVQLNPNNKFSGKGTLSYQLTENITATAGVELDKNEKLTVSGALSIPYYELFKKKGNQIDIFSIGASFPIPGLSFGPIGLKVRIDASLGAHYEIGPGALKNTLIAASFMPLEDDPDPKAKLTSLLDIPARAGVSGTLKGSIEADALIAGASLWISATATADLVGGISSTVMLEYSKARFVAEAEPTIKAGLQLGLSLDAGAEAHAGVPGFRVTTEKVWHLKHWDFDTGLNVEISVPIRYASDEPFKAPSLSDIKVKKPALDIGKVVDNAVSNASAQTKES
jgi:hypothetical protein